jgi:hypothetical protein
MQPSESCRRFRAVEQLQSIRDRYWPGSYEFEKADYAIELALSPRRSANAFLVPNTLRDAAKILKRRADNGPEFLSLDAPVVTGGDEEKREMTLHDLVPGQVPTPAEGCADHDFIATMASRLDAESSALVHALTAILHGETAHEFGGRTGLSESYYKKLKHEVRSEAQRLR